MAVIDIHARTPSGGDSDTDRPVILVAGGELPVIVDAALAALRDSGRPYYVYGERICTPILHRMPPRAGVAASDRIMRIMPVDAAHLADVLTSVARWQRWDARAQRAVDIDCTRRIAETILARGTWPLPPLAGVIEHPVITAHGRIIDTPGYDAGTALYLAHDPPSGYVRPPLAPSRAVAEAALQIIVDIWDECAVTDMADLSALVCAVLTAVMRRMLSAAPLIAITSPGAGTGKSEIIIVLGIIMTGRVPPMISLGAEPAEADKRLTAALLDGLPMIAMDNIERGLRGDLLCQAISQPELALRPLGNSAMVRGPTTALMCATGNNLAIIGDLRRRTMLIRLDARTERPETRQFARDLRAHVLRRRGEIISAAMTVMLAYGAAEFPGVGATPCAGFADWSRWCRQPVMWLGLPDPLDASASLRDMDPDLARMRALFAAWAEAYGDTLTTAADAITGATPALREAITAVCADHVSSRRLGAWLGQHRDRVVDGLRLGASLDARAKVQRWTVSTC
jgi:putative DNA primase/helicase